MVDYVVHTGVAQYQWACTESDEAGLRYVPSARDRDVVTVDTAEDQLSVYHLPQNLCKACYGKVIKIQYCYRYNTMMTEPAVFNWTVLLLKEQNMSQIGGQSMLRITDRIIIESHSNSINCTEGICCDETRVNESLNLSNKNSFGVTGPSQGNIHSATLLGFADSLSKYQVNITLLNSAEYNLSVGSTLTVRHDSVVPRGLRMLWFVIGK